MEETGSGGNKKLLKNSSIRQKEMRFFAFENILFEQKIRPETKFSLKGNERKFFHLLAAAKLSKI